VKVKEDLEGYSTAGVELAVVAVVVSCAGRK
jgi:hypothetical protein